MRELDYLGKMLAIFGFLTLLLGLLLIFLSRLFKSGGFGLLPGDILIRRGNFTFFFPIVTGLVLSLILTIVLNIVFWFLSRK